jgi:membrane-associated phospholipid phosphatase
VSVFAFFFSLSIITKHKAGQVLYFTVAMLVAYSRVYLSQHFAEDILAGSFVGVFVTFLYAYLHQRINAPWMERKIINY